MSPTVYYNTDTTMESDEMCEKNCTELNNGLNGEEAVDPKDRGMELQCAKRKLSSDELQTNKKRKRKETESDTVISSLSSSLSSNSDDYGTDTELIAINQNNKKRKNSCRYARLSSYDDLRDRDKGLHVINETGCNEQHLMYKHNFTISIDEQNITSSTSPVDEIVKKIITTTKISNANTRHLFEIAISTFKLMKKNQEFQVKLKELQTDTKNFIDSIIENPENQSVKEQLKLLM